MREVRLHKHTAVAVAFACFIIGPLFTYSDVHSQSTQPNIILLLVDDLAALEMSLGFGQQTVPPSSAFKTELIDKGTVFENFIISTPLCCPSRASYLTGQYSHNHGVHGNNYTRTGGKGGWRRFREMGHETNSIGSWMQQAGYQTVLVGKFLNGYPNKPGNFVPENYVPHGWSEWFGTYTNDSPFSYFRFRLNENGTIVQYGEDTPAYLTDVERDHAVDYINRIAPTGQPFFMYLAPFAPHGPTQPSAQHLGSHGHLSVGSPPSFNEADLSDKPQHLQGAQVSHAFFGGGRQRKLDMTLSLDGLIQAVFDALAANGQLDNTYIFFASDNGLLFGLHGIGGKSAPYEEAIRVPMVVRGPGIPAGVRRSELVMNIDLAPTILQLAGATLAASIDGESLVELMTGALSSQEWRDAVQVELLTTIASSNQSVVIPPYSGIRTPWHCYIEYSPTNEKELYDLVRDPYQLDSLHLSDPSNLLPLLTGPLTTFKTCSGTSCRQASRLGWPRVSLSSGCNALRCTFDAAKLSGNDIVSYTWQIGDHATATGSSVTHTFPDQGEYQVIVTGTDGVGRIGVASQRIVVSDGSVASLSVSRVNMVLKPPKSRAFAKVHVTDDKGDAVPGATVTGNWLVNDTLVGKSTGPTNILGRAKLPLLNPNSGDTLKFCVTDITHPLLQYNSGANAMTCQQAAWP